MNQFPYLLGDPTVNSLTSPIISGTPATPVTIVSIPKGTAAPAYTVAATYLPQTSLGNNTYRFTFNASIESLTIASPGNVTCWIYLVNNATLTSQYIGGQTIYVSASTTSFTIPYMFSISSEFVPLVGEYIAVVISNNTDGTITNLTLFPHGRGCAIELVSQNPNKVPTIFT